MDTNILRKDCPESSIPTEETPHGCWDGWVYMGFEGEDENGEHVEVIERECLAVGATPKVSNLRRAGLRLCLRP